MCTDKCGLCNVGSFTSECDGCPYPPGFKNVCVYSPSQGTWFLNVVPNDLVYTFFDTPEEQSRNFFAGEVFTNTLNQRVQSDCYCNQVSTTTSPTTTTTPSPPPIRPLVNCVSCKGELCYAILGYDARGVWSDGTTTQRLSIAGVNNYFITPLGNRGGMGQPTSFLVDLVPAASIITFPSGETWQWYLDGLVVDIAKSLSIQRCSGECEYPFTITANAVSFGNTKGVDYIIDLANVNEFSGVGECTPSHLIFDLPRVQNIQVRVSPEECLGGYYMGYIPSLNWDPSANHAECFYDEMYNPFSIPLEGGCNNLNVSIYVTDSNVVLGGNLISSLWVESCGSGCDTCKLQTLLSLESVCKREACIFGYFFNEDACECEECDVSTVTCPAFWRVNRRSCRCEMCPTDDCPVGQYLSPTECCVECTSSNCSGVCTRPTCEYGYRPSEDLCSCERCEVGECAKYTTADPITGCGCVPCDPGCVIGQIPSEDGCSCVPVNITIPPTTPEVCPDGYDVCGECGGNGRACLGCDGNVGTGIWIDGCGVRCGDGTSCPSCVGDNCAVCTLPVDICGVCGGNGSSCLGCDGLPPTLTRPAAQYDQCGVCDGNGTSCLGCAGVPFAGPCPTGITPGAAAAVSSLVALAGISGIVLAFILFRMRKRPEILYQAWDDTIREYVTQIEQNPIYDDKVDENNPLFEGGR